MILAKGGFISGTVARPLEFKWMGKHLGLKLRVLPLRLSMCLQPSMLRYVSGTVSLKDQSQGQDASEARAKGKGLGLAVVQICIWQYKAIYGNFKPD